MLISYETCFSKSLQDLQSSGQKVVDGMLSLAFMEVAELDLHKSSIPAHGAGAATHLNNEGM